MERNSLIQTLAGLSLIFFAPQFAGEIYTLLYTGDFSEISSYYLIFRGALILVTLFLCMNGVRVEWRSFKAVYRQYFLRKSG